MCVRAVPGRCAACAAASPPSKVAQFTNDFRSCSVLQLITSLNLGCRWLYRLRRWVQIPCLRHCRSAAGAPPAAPCKTPAGRTRPRSGPTLTACPLQRQAVSVPVVMLGEWGTEPQNSWRGGRFPPQPHPLLLTFKNRQRDQQAADIGGWQMLEAVAADADAVKHHHH